MAILLLVLAGCESTSMDNDSAGNGAMMDDNGMTADNNGAMTSDDGMMQNDGSSQNEIATPYVTFNLNGYNYAFSMDGVEAQTLTVNNGDFVRVELTSTNGFHDWVVDEFNAATERVQTGQTTYIEFVADQTGTFEYYCSVGQHRANGMWGNLVVQ